MNPRIERQPLDEKFDRLIVDGVELGTILRAGWEIEPGMKLAMGNLPTGHTVCGEDTGDLVRCMIERRDLVAAGEKERR